MKRKIPRRDRIYFVGLRAAKLNRDQAAAAWWNLGSKLLAMDQLDVPKYKDLVTAIRNATIEAQQEHKL